LKMDQAAQVQNIQVTIPGGPDLRVEPFEIPEEPLKTSKAWEEWLTDLEEAMEYHEIKEEMKPKALKQFCGKEVKKLIRSLPDPQPLPDQDNPGQNLAETEYEKTKRKLNNYFIPKRNRHYAVYLFTNLRQKRDETVASYAARLREQARHCEFEDEETRILEHMIQTLNNKDLVRRTISKQWDLNTLLVEASQLEQTKLEVSDMEHEKSTAAIAKTFRGKPPPSRGRGRFGYHQGGRFGNHQGGRFSYHQRGRLGNHHGSRERSQHRGHGRDACNYCGNTGTHPPGRNCPAYEHRCRICNVYGHFERKCHHANEETGYRRGQRRGRGHTPRRGRGSYRSRENTVKRCPAEIDNEDSSGTEEFIRRAVDHLSIKKIIPVRKISAAEWEETVRVEIDGVPAMCEPDNGAFTNLMDEYQYRALQKHNHTIQNLDPPSVGVKTIQCKLEPIGEFRATVRTKYRGIRTTFTVLKGKMDSPPLLSKDTSRELGFLLKDKEGRLNGTNEMKIKKTPTMRPEEQFPACFEGIGEIKDMRNNTNMEVHLEIEEDAIPVAQKPRHVPYYLVKPLKEWLELGVKEGIFEEVGRDEAITWCSPLVVQPKPKFIGQKILGPDQIRACIDMRVVNESMKRSRVVQAPVIEDFTYAFNDCKVFSKLDLKQGYHQLTLDEESRKLATFSTPWGNYRPRRLVFGAKSSQDLFDNTMSKIFGGIPRVLNQRDDILIGGRTDEEHDHTLKEVLRRAQAFNITFNKEKCEFRTTTIDFFGHRFTAGGLQPDPRKVEAVNRCKEPANKEETRSFLGMTGYLSDFVPEYARITAPLRELTRKDTPFKWGHEQQRAFEELKKSITCERTMAYFDPARPIVVRTEASFNEGLAAALLQKHGSTYRPVHFISRSLTEVEKRYSQTEKDALAIVWAKKRLRIYLLGAPMVRIITAHKPLIPMFNKSTAKLPPRIEKWVGEMQDIEYQLEYVPGKDERDPLDYLSRHPLRTTEDNDTEKIVKWITQQEHAVLIKDIQKANEEDQEIQRVKEILRSGQWEKYRKDPEINPYYHIREELYESENMLMRDNKIILPTKLRRKTVVIAHKMGHLGRSKTKEMLRRKYWFPEMNSLIESVCGQCFDCQTATRSNRSEPVKVTEIPSVAWDTVSADFGGPFPDGHYNLVIVDKRSRYPVVEEATSTNFSQTRCVMKKIFATYGTPRCIETDGGPPFNGREFKQFAEEEGFRHHIVTPEHARANGEAERFMQTLNKTERIINQKTKDKYERRAMVENMLTAYRDTPHPATGVTPYDAMKNRRVRTRLESGPQQQVPQDSEIDRRDRAYKQKMKAQKENRNTREHNLVKGDCVLVEQKKTNKWSLPYEPMFYTVIEVKGSTVTARRISDGRVLTRDGSKFKIANNLMREEEGRIARYGSNQEEESETEEDDSWREQILETHGMSETRERLDAHKTITPHLSGINQPSAVQTPTVPVTPQPEIPQPGTPRRRLSAEAAMTPTRPSVMDRPRRERRQPVRFKDYIQ